MRLLAGLLLLLSLTACDGHDAPAYGEYRPVVIDTPTGPVTCVAYKSSSAAAALDCDWAGR